MYKYLVLFICLFNQCIIKAQDSINVKALQKKLLNSYPKKTYSIKANIDDAKNYYVYNKSNNEVFITRSIYNKHDTGYIFYYIDKKIAFAVLIVWPDNAKRKGVSYQYYIENGVFVPIKNSPSNNQGIYDAIKTKEALLYKKAEAALSERNQLH